MSPDLGDLAHHDDQPDHLDTLIDTLLTQHLRAPTIEELIGVIPTADLVWGACVGYTAHQARVIANRSDYLIRLTRIWNIQVPEAIIDIVGQPTDLGALHRTLLEATGHPQHTPHNLDQQLDEDLWTLLEQLTLTKGTTPAQTTTLTCTDPPTNTQITLTPTPPNTWTAYLETDNHPLTAATLHLHWTDGTTTTHPINDTDTYEETTIPITPPTPTTRPDKARITTH